MHRLLIAAATLAFIAVTAAPALADEYPPCSHNVTDKCRVVPMGHHHGHHGHGEAHHRHHKGH